MKKILILFISLSLFFNGLSQHFNFRNFNLEDGLPQNSVYNIFQDDKGYIWLGTQGGVAKFNGIDFLNYDQKTGLAGNHVVKICQDHNKNIWLGHRYEGFSCIKENQVIIGNLNKQKHSIIEITPWKDGIISITSTVDSLKKLTYVLNYLFLKKNEIIAEKIDLETTFQKNQIKSRNEDLYIATKKGLHVFNDNLILKKIFLKENQIIDFDWDQDGTLYILSKNIITVLCENGDQKEIPINKTYGELTVSDIDEIWLYNETEALFITENKKQIINSKNGLPNSIIHCISEDKEGNVWFGLHGHGLSQLVPANFETFDESQGLKSDQISSLCMDHLSRLWVISQNNIDIIEFHENSNFSLKNIIHLSELIEIDAEELNFIFQDSRSWMWLGTDNGVYIIDSAFNIIHHISEEDGLLNNFIISIGEDHDQNIWLASLYHGIAKISITNKDFALEVYDKNNGLCSNSFWTVFIDSKGMVYFGSNDAGITYWNGNKFDHINEKQGLLNLRAGSITEDIQNNLWIGTIGGGIFKYNGDTCMQFSSKHGLSSDNPYLVLADDLGNIWTGTNTGIDMMSINTLPNKKNKSLFKHYGLNQGFLGIECNQNAKIKDENGNLWFGTVNGVIECNSNNITEDTIPPKLHITEKKLFLRKSIVGSKNLFKYNENHITFNFIGLHFTNPYQVKYQYKLENFDKSWSPWTKNTTATYSYLPPGKFTFKIKAANGDQYESEIKTYEFEITPPYWDTLWFYTLCFFTILILLFVIMRLRTLKIRKDKRILENKVDIRTKELNTEKEKVESQKEIIEIKNKNITDSILYAKTIQESVLPNQSRLKNYFNDHFIYYEPRDIVSGDFYWFKQKKDYMIIAAADCTGHGIPGAFLSMLACELLNQIVLDPKINSPAKAIELLDLGIYNAMHKDENSIRHDGLDLSICVFNKQMNTFQYSGARRPIIVLSDKNLEIYNPVLCSVGEMKKRGEKPIEIDIPIKKGDRVYMFSDGFIDQFGGPKNKKFLQRRLTEIILKLADTPLNEQTKIFNDTFIDWKGENEQIDDLLIMAIEL